MFSPLHASPGVRLSSGLVMTLVAVLATGVDHRVIAAGVSWGYSGSIGPEHWVKNFAACGMGRNQSPINIADPHILDIGGLVTGQQTLGSKPAGFLRIKFNYQAVPLRIINNGHAVEVRYGPGSEVTVHGRARALKQFHFHTPSENQIGGESFPMEAHLVHADEDDNLTVVAVLFKEGKANPFIERLRAHMPEQVGKEAVVADEKINVRDLLPTDTKYYYYNGSLTTPPCSEGVAWLVLREPIEASKEQIDTFRSTVGFANNRPVQQINTRLVITW